MQETWVRSMGEEDPLEKEMDNPLQYSYLENPVDRGAWRAVVRGGLKELDTTERLSACVRAHTHTHTHRPRKERRLVKDAQ